MIFQSSQGFYYFGVTKMRNILIILILFLSGCTQASYLADLAIKKGAKILNPPITCEMPRYNIHYNINKLDLKKRFSLAGHDTGCFSLGRDYAIWAEIKKDKQNQILEVRLYRKKSLCLIHAYQVNLLNLQDKINDSLRDILITIQKNEVENAKSS